jgi:hypothetical protein
MNMIADVAIDPAGIIQSLIELVIDSAALIEGVGEVGAVVVTYHYVPVAITK